ncbi:hypothetical protein QPK87_19980 [Kamptonema cortianum]|nr:hypothetical protein [Geitlerinema splendidum]MDK3158838.1 hypothetical protein [Kamptonema cortianum]
MQDVQKERRRPEPLDPRVALVYRKLAGEMADRYVEEFMLPSLARSIGSDDLSPESLREALSSPWPALQAFFGHYAFSRRGRDREELSAAALAALEPFSKDSALLAAEDGVSLWDEFCSVCESKGRKPNEAQNRGLIQGMMELAQEAYADQCISLFDWVANAVASEHKLEPQFLRIVDIRGVGPKSTSAFLRDVVYLSNLESQLEASEKIYVQPVDRWLRLVSKYVVPEKSISDAADWIIAGKISKYARRANVSSIRFNMGVTYFGQKVAKEPLHFSECLRAYIHESER